MKAGWLVGLVLCLAALVGGVVLGARYPSTATFWVWLIAFALYMTIGGGRKHFRRARLGDENGAPGLSHHVVGLFFAGVTFGALWSRSEPSLLWIIALVLQIAVWVFPSWAVPPE